MCNVDSIQDLLDLHGHILRVCGGCHGEESECHKIDPIPVSPSWQERQDLSGLLMYENCMSDVYLCNIRNVSSENAQF